MNSKKFLPIEPPKIIKQNYFSDTLIDLNPSNENSDFENDDEDDDDENDNDDDDDDEEIIQENYSPRVIQDLTSPFVNVSEKNNYLNKMTLDLMINPHYLSKANPDAFQKKREQAQRILKNRKEIYQTLDDCFSSLENLISNNDDENIDLDIQTGFLHFAKTVLLNKQQTGKTDTEPIFSTCNDVFSSFYPNNG